MLIWIVIAIVLLIIDQVTKILAVSVLSAGEIIIIQGFFRLKLAYNDGGVFSLGSGIEWLFYIFIGAAIIASIVFVILFIKTDHKNPKLWLFSLSLALLFAGTIGNCLDRIFRYEHVVVDFIDFYGIWNAVFNVADMCLSVGIACFLIDQLLLEPRRVKKNEQTGV